jgi:hypothetical protein
MNAPADLALIADAFRKCPGIAAVRRRSPDDLIPREIWLVFLEGDWKADQAGTGNTIEEAYQDALNRRSMTKEAA